MGIHLHSPQWAVLGNRRLDDEIGSPVIAGYTFLPVSGPVRERFRHRMSAADVSADDTAAAFVALVTDAAATVKADIDRLAGEAKAYRALVTRDLKQAAENADAAMISDVIAEITENLVRPESTELRKAQALIDDLRDATEYFGEDTDFDPAPLPGYG